MIRTATQDDLKDIAVLHKECFPDYFLTKLGLNLLAKYYKEFMTAGDIFLIDIDANTLNGLLVGTPLSSVGRNNFIKHNRIALVLRVLWLCIKFDNDTWDRVFGYIKPSMRQNDNNSEVNPSEIEPSLLSICVSDNCKGKGIAKNLVEEFGKRLIVAGYRGYTLTVHKSNTRANNFYEKMGMTTYKETDSEYGYRKRLVSNSACSI